jgi:opacity protein-like surface antigen
MILVRALLSILLISFCANANAASTREGRVDLSIGAIYNQSISENGSNGSSLDVDSEIGFAFSAAYNITSRLAVGFEGGYVRPDYTTVINSEDSGLVELKHTLTVGTGMFNAIYNFSSNAFTPYVQAGLGWTYVDSNISDGPPVTGCWWDPWWGYVCRNFYSTYDSNDFAYGVGAGLRYDTMGSMFVKGGYTYTWIDGDADVDQNVGVFRLELGWQL